MAITTSYTLISFDPITAELQVDVEVFDNSLPILITTLIITLPVDDLGNVPTGTALTDIIDKKINYRLQGWIAQYNIQNNIPISGVTNAEEIYALTLQVEADEIGGGQIYVLLTPNPDFIDVNNLCTRSIITVISGRNNFSRPFYPGDPPVAIGIDNGNLSHGGSTGLLRVRSGTLAEQPGVLEIPNANDNAGDLPVAAWVYTQYPNFLDGTTVTPEEGFDGYQYYIEHDPIEIDASVGAITTAVFSY